MNWYPPDSIKYTKAQVRFILNNLVMMKEGVYPESPLGSSYIEVPGGKKVRRRAPFETSCLIVGELEARLKKTGRDGIAAKAFYTHQFPIYEIAWLAQWDKDETRERIKRAVDYVTGWERKDESYGEFVNREYIEEEK